jgi:ABC-type antimicrobial peptide transport system permease subunit
VNGFSNGQIAGMIFGESGIVSIVGAVAGLLIDGAAIVAVKMPATARVATLEIPMNAVSTPATVKAVTN